MNDIITNLQNKSDQEKSVVAIVVAVFVTVTLFGAWGYNFANSGNISNLASSATGVASAVESLSIGESFDKALEQIKSASSMVPVSQKESESQAEQKNSVGNRYINVFANPDAMLY